MLVLEIPKSAAPAAAPIEEIVAPAIATATEVVVAAVSPAPMSPPGPSSVGAVVTELIVSEADDAPLVITRLPSGRRSRFRVVPAVLAVLLCAASVAVIGGVLSRDRSDAGAATTPTVTADPEQAAASPVVPPEPAAAPPPTPIAPPEPVAPPAVVAPAKTGMGSVITSAATPGRRIFVDQRTVGQTPEAVLVKCGLHRVRLGSAGKTVMIDVPCEGEVSVTDR